MAIDTEAKRRAALDHDEIWADGAPEPDGTISTADRQHLLWSYPIPAIVFDGLLGVGIRRRAMGLDVRPRAGIYYPARILLPDGRGYWLFGDGSHIMWAEGDQGDPVGAQRHIDGAKVKRDG